uniref:protein ROOT INITIATION DEFECTIVE 3-like n=1 Tax=Erigeron canadensis TaxID=72917 RepID=UPI001CB964A7|nr:protein ROOT INITIATION DEFECTIVE 3-like [Erigeron canadensis]
MLETLLIASPDGRIIAYDPYTGTVLARFNGSRCPCNSIAIVGNNQFAVSHVSEQTGAGCVNLYYWWSKSCAQSIPIPEPVVPLTAMVDGSYLFAGGVSGHIHSLSVPSGDLIHSFSAHEHPVSCLAISSDGSLVLSGSDDGTIAVTPILLLLDSTFDIESRISGFNKFIGHESSVTGLSTGLGPCSGIMISSSLDWTCKVWNVVKGIHLQTVNFPGEMLCTVLDASETELYAAGADGIIYKRKLKVETKNQLAEGRETIVWGRIHSGAVAAIEMANYGRTLLAVSENGRICAWETENGKMTSSFCKKTGTVSSVVLVKGGGWFRKRGTEKGEFNGYGGTQEVGKMVKQVAEMGETLKVVAEDRGREISNLESAIEVNEKLLNLMLKEAKAIAKFEDSKLTLKLKK